MTAFDDVPAGGEAAAPPWTAGASPPEPPVPTVGPAPTWTADAGAPPEAAPAPVRPEERAAALAAAGVVLHEPPTGREGSLVATPSGEHYADPAVFAREQERILEREWICAVRIGDLEEVGAYRTVDVGRESVIVVQGRDRVVRAFLNACRHRGARICTETAGTAKRALRCPYHAWTYDLDGRLKAAPNLVRMPDVDKGALGLIPVALREWLGYAWVCLAEEPPDFDATVAAQAVERLGDLALLDAYDVPSLALARRITYDVAANWKLVIENFMECYHCASIHPELTEVLPEFADGFAAQYFVGHGAAFGEDVAGFTVDGSAGAEALGGIAEDQDRRYYAITVRPTVFVNLVPDHVIVHRMFPLAADRTVVECDWLFAPGVVESGADVSAQVELFHRVNEQDFDACERCQPSMTSRAYAAGGLLVPSEHHIAEFHDWWARAMAGD